MSYDTIPSNASLKPESFNVNFPHEDVEQFYQLLKLSKLGPRTFENSHDEVQPSGLPYKWFTEAKIHWESKYDW